MAPNAKGAAKAASSPPAATPQPAPAASLADADTVSAKKPRATPLDPEPATDTAWPTLPQNIATVNTHKIMREVVPFVLQRLPRALDADGIAHHSSELAACPPLPITDGRNELRNYKEVWSARNCKVSVETSGLYEAGGNLFWVDMHIPEAVGRPGQDAGLSGVVTEEPALSQVIGYAEQFFSVSEGSCGKPSAGSDAERRLMFPDVIGTVVAAVSQLNPIDVTPHKLKLSLIAGHALLYAWYWAMGIALRDDGPPAVKALWVCALTCTIRVTVCDDSQEINIATIKISEKYNGFQKGMSDTFVLWARKVATIVDTKLGAQRQADQLVRKGTTSGGEKVSKQMMLSAAAITGSLDEANYADLKLLEREFGRDLVSGYVKLPKFVQAVKAACPQDFNHFFSFGIRVLWLTLRRRLVPGLEWFTQERLDTKGNHGEKTAGWVAMTMCKGIAVRHLLGLMTAMDSEAGHTMHSTLSVIFSDPFKFYALFKLGADAACPAAAAPSGEEEAQGNEEGKGASEADSHHREVVLQGLGEQLGRAGQFAAELLYDMHIGEYDAVLKTLAEGKAPPAVELHKVEGESLGGLGTKLREFMRLASPVVPATIQEQGAPAPSLRCLARISSDPGGVSLEDRKAAIVKERQQLWAKAQAQRKRFCRMALWDDRTLQGLEAVVKNNHVVSGFSGKLNEAHRAFVLSCDLISENDKAPWAAFACPRGPAVDARLSYMLARDGSTDFVFFFDGRSRQARRLVEDKAHEKTVTLEEAWIVYKDIEPAAKRQRKVCLSSRTKEVMYCRLPVARVKVATKPRTEFSAVGEDSTHHTTFTGVPLPATVSLARISYQDKKLIFPGCGPTETEAKPEGWRRGPIPLYWNESKGGAFWRMWLDAFDVKVVVDLSPGTGQLAIASLGKGVQYLGVLTDTHHLSWLTNIIDRESLRLIGESSSAVYQEQMSEHIKEHFADVLDELNTEEKSEGEDDGEDETEEADDFA